MGQAKKESTQHVINFDTEAKVPFPGAILVSRTGLTGTIAFELKNLKAESKLKDGETSITGHTFLKRVKAGKKALPNSNIIDWLEESQYEPEVKEFLVQYKNGFLYSFEDIFRDSDGNLCVRCISLGFAGHFLSTRWEWLDNVLNGYHMVLSLTNTK